uniref:Reverse transcriptase domain-containing protein n=1 Tax=Tanacetum cinerariifolium TaxID=118510 RepID=A0A6L2MZ25_TANCI|nr:reverse transcriptase domain-containing protein [Tanacetum cinerariifolium]
MSTRSTSSNLFSPLRDPESLIRRRNLGEPSSLFDFEEVTSIHHQNQRPPPAGPPPPNNNGPPPLIDTFYYGLTLRHRDTIIAAAGGTVMQKTPEECYDLIENMTAHHNYWNTSATREETSRNISSTTTTESPEVIRQLEIINKNFLDMMRQMQSVKSVNMKCETCGGPHSFTECPAVGGYIQEAAYATMGNHNSGGNSYQPQGDRNMLSYRSNNYLGPPVFPPSNVQNNQNYNRVVAYDGPMIPPTPSSLSKEVERETEAAKDKVQATSSESTAHVKPSVIQVSIPEPEVAPKPIPYPSRLNDQKLREKINSKMLSNKEKLFELANTPLTENCSAVLLKKLLEKLEDLGGFLIPCDFQRLELCMALADLGASINLMPLYVWKKLSLPDLTSTRMTLELATRSIAYPAGIAEDVFVQVGEFSVASIRKIINGKRFQDVTSLTRWVKSAPIKLPGASLLWGSIGVSSGSGVKVLVPGVNGGLTRLVLVTKGEGNDGVEVSYV